MVDSQGAVRALSSTLDQTRTFADALIENARESILVLDEGLRVTLANPVFYKTFQVSPEETRGRLIYELDNHQWDIPRLRELFHEIMTHNTRIDGFEVRHKFQHLGLRHMILNARRIEHCRIACWNSVVVRHAVQYAKCQHVITAPPKKAIIWLGLAWASEKAVCASMLSPLQPK